MIGFTGVDFAPGGTRLAAGAYDGTITLWNMESGLQIASWRAHRKQVNRIYFDQASESLISVGIGENSDTSTETRAWRAPVLPETFHFAR